MLGMPYDTVRKLISKHKTLPAFKQGGKYYISKDAIDKYISDKTLETMGLNQEILEAFIYSENVKQSADNLRATGKYKDEDLDKFIEGAEMQLAKAIKEYKNDKSKE